MSRGKKKRGSADCVNPPEDPKEVVEEEEIKEEQHENEERTSSWLYVTDMNGNRFIRCSNCGSAIRVSAGTITNSMLRHMYCYHCGDRMTVNDASII